MNAKEEKEKKKKKGVSELMVLKPILSFLMGRVEVEYNNR